MADTARKREVLFLQDANGKEPLTIGLESGHKKARAAYLEKITSLSSKVIFVTAKQSARCYRTRFFSLWLPRLFGWSIGVRLSASNSGINASQNKDIKKGKSLFGEV